jgi:hypothetical protein
MFITELDFPTADFIRTVRTVWYEVANLIRVYTMSTITWKFIVTTCYRILKVIIKQELFCLFFIISLQIQLRIPKADNYHNTVNVYGTVTAQHHNK